MSERNHSLVIVGLLFLSTLLIGACSEGMKQYAEATKPMTLSEAKSELEEKLNGAIPRCPYTAVETKPCLTAKRETLRVLDLLMVENRRRSKEHIELLTKERLTADTRIEYSRCIDRKKESAVQNYTGSDRDAIVEQIESIQDICLTEAVDITIKNVVSEKSLTPALASPSPTQATVKNQTNQGKK
jgi:hypothetical protein